METSLLQTVTEDTNIANKCNRTNHTVMKCHNAFTAILGYSCWIRHAIQLDCVLGKNPGAVMLFDLNYGLLVYFHYPYDWPENIQFPQCLFHMILLSPKWLDVIPRPSPSPPPLPCSCLNSVWYESPKLTIIQSSTFLKINVYDIRTNARTFLSFPPILYCFIIYYCKCRPFYVQALNNSIWVITQIFRNLGRAISGEAREGDQHFNLGWPTTAKVSWRL